MPKKFLNTFFSPLNSQSGQSTIYIILIIVVIIFAVMMTGGGGSLFTGNEPSSITDEPSPTANTTTPGSTTSTPTPDAAWSITIAVGSCQQGKSPYKAGAITAVGNANGYITLEIEKTPNNWTLDTSAAFTPPSFSYTVTLPNDAGYNTKNWRIRLFSGGTNNGGTWSGGIEKTPAKTGPPTGCT